MDDIREKRRYIRISLRGNVIKDIGLESNIGKILYNNKLISCIINNISISGALLVVESNNNVFEEKETLVLTLKDSSSNDIVIPAEIVYTKDIGKESRIGIGVEFKDKLIPVKYEALLEEFWRKSGL